MFRFGQESKENIHQEIEQLTPANTRKSKASVWRQFINFCAEKSYNFDRADIPVEELALILEDYGFNMRKKNSEDYKESVIKVLWNSTPKQLQEYFFDKYNRKFNPFSDIQFLNARAAKNAKRRKLQMDPTKRKESSSALSAEELRKIIEFWDENTPEGLQRKFFHVAGHELAWRGNEGAAAQLEYFVEEIDNRGKPTGRIEYNPVFSKTTQGGSKKMADTELLVKCNTDNTWYPRRVQVRSGQLQVFSVPGEPGPSSLRLPLRHLSLQAGPLPHSLAICRGQNIVLTLQTANEKAFDQWVKTLAIELIRQTPLDAIKYLDILTLAECWTRREDHYTKDWNFNNVAEKETSCISCEKNREADSHEDIRVPEWKYEKHIITEPKETFSNDCGSKIHKETQKVNLDSPQTAKNPEEVVETLLKKCQNVETYVPVKEKLFLFESLCKMGRKVRSSEDVSLKPETSTTKRAKSCHDLSNLNTHIAVRDICKYFEDRGGGEENKTQKKVFSNNLRSARFQKTITT